MAANFCVGEVSAGGQQQHPGPWSFIALCAASQPHLENIFTASKIFIPIHVGDQEMTERQVISFMCDVPLVNVFCVFCHSLLRLDRHHLL